MDKFYVIHTPASEVSEGQALKVEAEIAGPERPESVELFVAAPGDLSEALKPAPADPNAQPGGNHPRQPMTRSIPMTPHGLSYTAVVPPEMVRLGTLRYHVVVTTTKGRVTFPSGHSGEPLAWDFYGAPWEARVTSAQAPLVLFEAASDARGITADHRDVSFELGPTDKPGGTGMVEPIADLTEEPHDFSWRFFCRDRVHARRMRVSSAKKLAIVARSLTGAPCLAQLSLVTRDGATFGAAVTIEPRTGACAVDVADLKPVRSPNIPHGYPVFIPQWSPAREGTALDLSAVESVMLSVGPGIAESDRRTPRALSIERIWLE